LCEPLNDAVSLYRSSDVCDTPFDHDTISQHFMLLIFNDLVQLHSKHVLTIQYIFSLRLKKFSKLRFVCAEQFDITGSALEKMNEIMAQHMLCDKKMRQIQSTTWIFDKSFIRMCNTFGQRIVAPLTVQ